MNMSRACDRMMSGAAAGLTATIPMTLVMVGIRAALPAEKQRRMPPREIVDRTVENARETTGGEPDLDRGDRTALTAVAHLAFGAAAGAVYGAATGRRGGSVLTGIAYGVSLWAAAYGVGLPSLGLHPAAQHDTKDRNEVLIASHVVWGAALGMMTRATLFGSSVSKQRTEAPGNQADPRNGGNLARS